VRSSEQRGDTRRRVWVMPSQGKSGAFAASAYVRLIYPFTCAALSDVFDVEITHALPTPKPGEIAVLQRQVIGVEMSQLSEWLQRCKAVGMYVVYDLDDDLLDEEALRH